MSAIQHKGVQTSGESYIETLEMTIKYYYNCYLSIMYISLIVVEYSASPFSYSFLRSGWDVDISGAPSTKPVEPVPAQVPG